MIYTRHMSYMIYTRHMSVEPTAAFQGTIVSQTSTHKLKLTKTPSCLPLFQTACTLRTTHYAAVLASAGL